MDGVPVIGLFRFSTIVRVWLIANGIKVLWNRSGVIIPAYTLFKAVTVVKKTSTYSNTDLLSIIGLVGHKRKKRFNLGYDWEQASLL